LPFGGLQFGRAKPDIEGVLSGESPHSTALPSEGRFAMARLPKDLPAWHPAAWLATWFGSGLLPWAPGTWGSLAALPFAWGLYAWAGPFGLTIAAAVVFVLGVWAADVYAGAAAEGDPGPVVIDEVAGQWLVLVAVDPGLVHYGVGFALFRLADIAKPWPVSWADRSLKGGLGIMLDDVLAAVYAGAALLALDRWVLP
jgi:phosphatidylglycerophosphatase A